MVLFLFFKANTNSVYNEFFIKNCLMKCKIRILIKFNIFPQDFHQEVMLILRTQGQYLSLIHIIEALVQFLLDFPYSIKTLFVRQCQELQRRKSKHKCYGINQRKGSCHGPSWIEWLIGSEPAWLPRSSSRLNDAPVSTLAPPTTTAMHIMMMMRPRTALLCSPNPSLTRTLPSPLSFLLLDLLMFCTFADKQDEKRKLL